MPVRSLNRRRHVRHWNLRYPSSVRRSRRDVALDRQCGQVTGQLLAIASPRLPQRALRSDRTLLVSGPDDLRAALRGSTVFELVTTAARLRPD